MPFPLHSHGLMPCTQSDILTGSGSKMKGANVGNPRQNNTVSGSVCVAMTVRCWLKVSTFGCRGDMLPTCCQHFQPIEPWCVSLAMVRYSSEGGKTNLCCLSIVFGSTIIPPQQAVSAVDYSIAMITQDIRYLSTYCTYSYTLWSYLGNGV